MKKAIFWDFDGTLVHANESFLGSLEAALQQYGCAIDRSTLRQFLSEALSWHVPEEDYPDRTGSEWWGSLWEKLSGFCRANGIDGALHRPICEAFRENALHFNYTVYPDAEEVLAFCKEKGIENYLLSNNYPELIAVVEWLGLARYFSGFFVSSLIGYEKPRRELFDHALETVGFPDRCWMVGDNPVADIAGAQSAGITAILVHKNASAATPDYFCRELAEIKHILAD